MHETSNKIIGIKKNNYKLITEKPHDLYINHYVSALEILPQIRTVFYWKYQNLWPSKIDKATLSFPKSYMFIETKEIESKFYFYCLYVAFSQNDKLYATFMPNTTRNSQDLLMCVGTVEPFPSRELVVKQAVQQYWNYAYEESPCSKLFGIVDEWEEKTKINPNFINEFDWQIKQQPFPKNWKECLDYISS